MNSKRKRDDGPVPIEEVYKCPLYIELEKFMCEIGLIEYNRRLREIKYHTIYGKDSIAVTPLNRVMPIDVEFHLGAYRNDQEREKVVRSIKNKFRDYPQWKMSRLEMKRERDFLDSDGTYFPERTVVEITRVLHHRDE